MLRGVSRPLLVVEYRVMQEPVTGPAATVYLGAWFCAAQRGHGLNAARVARDAHRCRNTAVRGRLGFASRVNRPVMTLPSLAPHAVRQTRQPKPVRRGRVLQERGRPRLAGAV